MVFERRKNRRKNGDEEDASSVDGIRIVRSPSSPMSPPDKRGRPYGGSNMLIASKSAMILVIGILIGYVVVPMALVELNVKDIHNRSSYGADGAPRMRHLQTADSIQERVVQDQKLLSTQSLPTITSPTIMHTPILSDHRRKKIVVTGGAGFVGSHLVDKLMMEGHEVTVLDNFFTGQKKNIAHWLQHPNFRSVI